MLTWLPFKALASGFALDVDGAGGGGGSTTTETSTDKTDSSSKTETAPEKPEKGSRTFTQDEVSKLTAEEKRQGKKEGEQAANAALLARLKKAGVDVENLDTIEALLVEDKKRRDADLTATERLEKDLKAALERAEKAEKDLVDQATTAQKDRRDAAVKGALRDAGVRKEDADDAFFLMEKRGLFETLLDKDGKVDEKAVTAAVEKYKKEKPAHFAPQGAGSRSNNDGQTPSSRTNREQTVRREKRRNFD